MFFCIENLCMSAYSIFTQSEYMLRLRQSEFQKNIRTSQMFIIFLRAFDHTKECIKEQFYHPKDGYTLYIQMRSIFYAS